MNTSSIIGIFIVSIILLFTNCSDDDNGEKENILPTWLNRMDDLFSTLEANNQGIGSIRITKDGKSIFSKSTGYLNVENKIKSNSETKYRIGSISKTFTAVLFFKALEEQRITLDQTLETYFPTIANAPKIRMSQLLSHESGIPNYTEDPLFFNSYILARTKEEMTQIIEGYKPDFEPGSKIVYSNTNYLLISYILEELYTKSYGDILKEKITIPLQLDNTYLSESPKPKEDEAFSYFHDGGWVLKEEVDPSLLLGAGAIVSTPSDVCKFINALFSHKVISETSLSLMTTLKGADYMGMGIAGGPIHNGQAIIFGHSGTIDMFRATFLYDPSDKVCITYCLNGIVDEGPDDNMNNYMLDKLLSIYEGN
ncbi:MAG: serine hydrolase domain-containing protein [Dysgonomonas sp.]|nr:serine hydrolase domain-containing protein [Dysgonomonas sp.]